MGPEVVEFLVLVEDQLGIRVPDEVAPGLATVGQLFDFACAQITRATGPDFSRDAVWQDLCEILATRFGLASSAIVPHARFAEDLRID